jgi:hypothetical protein
LQTNQIWLGQSEFAQKIIDLYGYEGMNPADTLWRPKFQIPIQWEVIIGAEKPYQRINGSTNYLAIGTRSDITWTNNKLYEANAGPLQHYFNAQKHLLRYIKGTVNLGIVFGGKCNFKTMGLYAVADAAHDDVLGTRHSTSGYVVFLANAPIY